MIKKNTITRIKTSFFLLLFLFFMNKSNMFSTYLLIIFGVLSILEFLKLSKKIISENILYLILNTIFIIYIMFFCYLFLFLTSFIQSKILIYILLLGCIFSDLGGFVIGKIFKGPKLTKISPNKTVSGALGALIFTSISISLMFFLFFSSLSIYIVIISIITSLGCQLGDLLFSYLKRKAKIKDTGNILPGHGGVLDRLDGILIGVPAGFISIILLT